MTQQPDNNHHKFKTNLLSFTLSTFRRYIHDKEFFNELVTAAKDIPTATWVSGGNALAMANRLAMEGCEVLLGSLVSQRVKEMLHEHVAGMKI